MSKSPARTLAQQLRWQLLLAGLAFSFAIILSLNILTWRSVEFAADSFMRFEAHSLLKQITDDPTVPLPREKSFQAYKAWDDIPEPLRQVFSGVSIEDNRLHEEKFTDQTGVSEYVSLLHYVNKSGQSLYALSIYNANEIDEVIESIIGNMLTEAIWLILIIFMTLFILVFWLLKRTNEPLFLLSKWAERLKQDDHLSKEDFPIAELNDLAAQLKMGVDRITEYNLREQQFLKHASHEMRTPLATVQACLDTLNFKLTGPDKNTVMRALRASSNMNRLSAALLWLARESDKPINKTYVDVNELCRQQVASHQYLISNRDITIETTVSVDGIEIEEDLLLIVLANLLRNACQFTTEGVIKLSFNAEFLSIENSIELEQNESEAPYHSFGLGLQLVQRICQKLGWVFDFVEQDERVCVIVRWQVN